MFLLQLILSSGSASIALGLSLLWRCCICIHLGLLFEICSNIHDWRFSTRFPLKFRAWLLSLSQCACKTVLAFWLADNVGDFVASFIQNTGPGLVLCRERNLALQRLDLILIEDVAMFVTILDSLQDCVGVRRAGGDVNILLGILSDWRCGTILSSASLDRAYSGRLGSVCAVLRVLEHCY